MNHGDSGQSAGLQQVQKQPATAGIVPGTIGKQKGSSQQAVIQADVEEFLGNGVGNSGQKQGDSGSSSGRIFTATLGSDSG